MAAKDRADTHICICSGAHPDMALFRYWIFWSDGSFTDNPVHAKGYKTREELNGFIQKEELERWQYKVLVGWMQEMRTLPVEVDFEDVGIEPDN